MRLFKSRKPSLMTSESIRAISSAVSSPDLRATRLCLALDMFSKKPGWPARSIVGGAQNGMTTRATKWSPG